VRVWALVALVCLSLWGTGTGTIQDASDPAHGSQQAILGLEDIPSSDGGPDRRWEAAPAICPAGWHSTSQTHATVLVRALCQSMARAPRAGDVSANSPPRLLRPQFQLPLLI
jgi:hypothetical protein